jgi:hypothetical protein
MKTSTKASKAESLRAGQKFDVKNKSLLNPFVYKNTKDNN